MYVYLRDVLERRAFFSNVVRVLFWNSDQSLRAMLINYNMLFPVSLEIIIIIIIIIITITITITIIISNNSNN